MSPREVGRIVGHSNRKDTGGHTHLEGAGIPDAVRRRVGWGS